MNKKTHFIIIILSVFYCAGSAYAQQCAVSLSGTYQLDPASEEGFYDTFVFDGAGKVVIHSGLEFKGDFFQVGDTVVVYPDKSIFTFLKKDEHTLVGLSTWVEGQVFRKMENDTVVTSSQKRGPDYANQFYRYYVLTGREGPSLVTYLNLSMDPAMQAEMEKLCDEGFPKACMVMAGTMMMGGPEVTAFLLGDSGEGKKMEPNKDIVAYYTKAIELGELDAMAELGAYYLMLGDEEEAQKIFEQGCDLGHTGCCLSLGGLEWDMEEE